MKKEKNTVCVMGMGYVGLTLSVVLAEVGYNVYGVDTQSDIIKKLKKGRPHIFEKNLTTRLNQQIKKNNIQFYLDAPKIFYNVIVISVGTPLKKGTKEPNLNFLHDVINDVSDLVNKGTLVVMRSTLPVGCTRNTVLPILEKSSNLKVGKDFYLAACPERTVEGRALEELRANSQIVGGISKECTEKAANLFLKLTSTVVSVSSSEASEFSKIIDNTFRDVKFSFSNQLALISESLGLNINEVIKAANTHYPRNNIPVPSPGVGGPCISKDPHILIDMSKKVGLDPKLIKVARKINEDYPKIIAKRIVGLYNTFENKSLNGNVFVAGFAFKGSPVTADIRDSTTISLINEVLAISSLNIIGYDPIVDSKEIKQIEGVTSVKKEANFENIDILIIANNHESYKDWDIINIVSTMNKPSIIYDGWSTLDYNLIKELKDVTYMGPGV